MQRQDIASVIRSRNAGPCLLAFDLMFASAADFVRTRAVHEDARSA